MYRQECEGGFQGQVSGYATKTSMCHWSAYSITILLEVIGTRRLS